MPRSGLRSAGKISNEQQVGRLMTLLESELEKQKSLHEQREVHELSERMRKRQLVWSALPLTSRKMLLPFLTAGELVKLDTAVSTDREKERDHLVKAYRGLRCPGLDQHLFSDNNDFEGIRWVRKREIDLRDVQIEYKGTRNREEVLFRLVMNTKEDMATYYATRSQVEDAVIDFNNSGFMATTLGLSSGRGYCEVARCLLDRGADVNRTVQHGSTPLCIASRHGELEMVKLLLAAPGIDVNAVSREGGNTALVTACGEGYVEIVHLLLATPGIDVNKIADETWTPLTKACWCGHVEVVRALLAAPGIDVNKVAGTVMFYPGTGSTPLCTSSFQGHVEIVRALLAAPGIDVNKVSSTGSTPLCAACRSGSVETVRILVAARGMDVNRRMISGETAASYILEDEHYDEIRDILSQAGAIL